MQTAAARAAAQSLLKSLSVELAPTIRVNSILLGLVESGQWQRRFEARAELVPRRCGIEQEARIGLGDRDKKTRT